MASKPLTEEQKKLFNERRRKTLLEKYGSETYNNTDKNRATKLERYGDSRYNNMTKNKQTCIERYGVIYHNQSAAIREKISTSKSRPEVQEKYEQTCIERYGVSNVNLVPEIREKRAATLLSRYGASNPLQNKEIKKRQLETLKANNSFTKSAIEDSVYEYLVSRYGSEDVIRQYNQDPRYPFSCDFYIRSEDLFIEVNNHPSHGDHSFNPESKEDLELLEALKKKNNAWAKMIIDVWTVRDVKKFNTARDNRLNYKVIYKSIDEIINE